MHGQTGKITENGKTWKHGFSPAGGGGGVVCALVNNIIHKDDWNHA